MFALFVSRQTVSFTDFAGSDSKFFLNTLESSMKLRPALYLVRFLGSSIYFDSMIGRQFSVSVNTYFAIRTDHKLK